ncbi:restriction endonuclease subunit S [Pseudoalteromonas sp. TB64]|uniref:restriction endonuclease subunit S n=1 Tax=Pseudoalteromonas sp. TB64 TaxID=1938600 RepID=UPI00041E4194|nr:restriction endonuclease subunit S [Pseudoalteromonas sp. TB64]
MVPNGWERKPIKELCESIIDCVNKTAKHVDYVTPFKMIRTTNVRNGRVDTENVRFVEEEIYKQWIRRGAPKDGDIIFTREAPVGEAGILENAKGIFLGQRTMMYRSAPEVSDNRFLFYSLMSGYCQKQIEDFSNGGTVAHMRVPDCGELMINTPPLPEQRKIATILSTWDKAISATERLIDSSKQQKKALMQQLLTGKKRLLDDSGKPFEGEWEEVVVGAVANLTAGGTPSTKHPEYWSGEIPWMNSGEVNLKQVCSVEGRITELGLKKSSTKEIPLNSILIALAGQGKTRGTVAINRIKLCTNQSIAAIMPNEQKLDSEYLYFNLDGRYKELRAMSTGDGGRGGLNLSILKSIKLKLPTLEEQKKIATALINADKEIDLLKQQLADLKQEKKALMQQLLTGKRRVKVDEKEVA